jgi:formylglycine-generating enzyme required for sulfatase activity
MIGAETRPENAHLPAGLRLPLLRLANRRAKVHPCPRRRQRPRFQDRRRPLTNAECAKSIAATGRTPPLHWEYGQPPRGFEDHPVTYVSRYDVEKYLGVERDSLMD